MSRHRSLVVDIETAPDRATLAQCGRRPRDAASRIWLHGLAAISWLAFTEQDDGTVGALALTSIAVACANDVDSVAMRERDALARLESALTALDDGGRLISFNGRRHDLPFLKLRRHHHHLFDATRLDRFLGADSDRHCDLLEILTRDGLRWPSLDEACAALRIPHGVENVECGGCAPAVARSQVDVLATFLLDRFRFASDAHAPLAFARAWSVLAAWCVGQGRRWPHLVQFATLPAARAALLAAGRASPG
ncbi:Predicted 3'-5' exonuclease related to the exonuclease domain of PolB [Sphingomonas laterariae]|uniref:Predicted 3'-5' exonuclease related to the exonuclease domain of PolB n=1 Tax=Edaphosphingomonas laterariae TaxID=861865 RepID=A0A239I8T0_9SPHN|nr:ribonuclease H-like domain-containing protein [Sphingomonas laterariae]SNS89967.1 Predicted 3'-5' exonuclease related to the exonuclease domain of PolB [Sphingomonas laterariae]